MARYSGAIVPVHHMHMPTKKGRGRPVPKPQLRRHFFKQWRLHRGLSLERLAERLAERLGGFTHASLSRIENFKQPYNQRILEALAAELGTDPASLLMRDPTDPDAMWSIWDNAQQGERQEIERYARYVIERRNTGT